MKEGHIEFRYCWSNSKPRKDWKEWSDIVPHNVNEYKHLWGMREQSIDGVLEHTEPEIVGNFPDKNNPNLTEAERVYLSFHYNVKLALRGGL